MGSNPRISIKPCPIQSSFLFFFKLENHPSHNLQSPWLTRQPSRSFVRLSTSSPLKTLPLLPATRTALPTRSPRSTASPRRRPPSKSTKPSASKTTARQYPRQTKPDQVFFLSAPLAHFSANF